MNMARVSLNVASVRAGKPKLLVWLVVVVGVVAAAGIAAGPIMSRVEQPKYELVERAGSIEIRNYSEMILAEAKVSGEREPAIQEGFRLIAAYIFGANKPNKTIAMSAPVQQEGKQKIAMTAPVSQQADENDLWIIRFVMPANRTLDTLPQPNDPRVTLHPQPARRMLVVRFSGLATGAIIETKTAELRNYASGHNLKTTGEALAAFYNPPWTLPIFRRNEIMLQIN